MNKLLIMLTVSSLIGLHTRCPAVDVRAIEKIFLDSKDSSHVIFASKLIEKPIGTQKSTLEIIKDVVAQEIDKLTNILQNPSLSSISLRHKDTKKTIDLLLNIGNIMSNVLKDILDYIQKPSIRAKNEIFVQLYSSIEHLLPKAQDALNKSTHREIRPELENILNTYKKIQKFLFDYSPQLFKILKP